MASRGQLLGRLVERPVCVHLCIRRQGGQGSRGQILETLNISVQLWGESVGGPSTSNRVCRTEGLVCPSASSRGDRRLGEVTG